MWEQAVRRLVVRMHARAHSYRKLMIDAEGRGQPPPPPAPLNKLLAGVAEVSGADGWLTWSAPFEAELMSFGVEVVARQERTAGKVDRVPLPPIAFVTDSASTGPEQDPPRPANEAPLLADEPRYAVKVRCSLWAELMGGDVEITATVSSATRQPDISTVAAGECLPLRENRADVIAATIEAVGKATATMREFHSRQQLLVFGTTYDMDVAEYYVGLLLGEMGRHQPVMTVKQLTPKKRIAETAKTIYESARSPTIDSRTMMGPREFHRANSERASRLRQRAAPPVIPLTVPLPSARDRRDDDSDELEDQIEDELEIMLEMGGGGPPPPDE